VAELSFSITGPFAYALTGELDNLVLRAVGELAERLGVRPHGHIVLEKNLPVASGLGGGSADAAATIKLMLRHWKLLPDPGDIRAVIMRLGADAPVCLVSRTAFVGGIGEKISIAKPLPDIGVVLINPGIPVSTADVFRNRFGGFSSPPVMPPDGWPTPRALVDSLEPTRNDLQDPAIQLVPQIRDVLANIEALPGCMMARMSGSGGTCFGIFETAEIAKAGAGQIKRPGWWIWGGGVRSYNWLV
jgi:4-diphosphocytidyl-2-C-methyl-D-erythritol kinase